MTRIFALVGCLSLACVRSQNLQTEIAPNEPLAAVAGQLDFVLLPQIADPSRSLGGGRFKAPPNPPACQLRSGLDTSSWRTVSTQIPSNYLKAVTLRLPGRLEERPLSGGSDLYAESGDYWGHILGSWDAMSGTWPNVRSEGMALWIGPEEGYPTGGIGGDSVVQFSLTECALDTDVGVLPIVLFAVRSAQLALGGYFVGTYWELQPGVFVTAQGHAPDSTAQAELLAALTTIRITK